jgi:hypothetical protein
MFDPQTILDCDSTTLLSLIEELACECSRFKIAETERKPEIWKEVQELVDTINLYQQV